jgi:hypothetical protein
VVEAGTDVGEDDGEPITAEVAVPGSTSTVVEPIKAPLDVRADTVK